MKQTSLFILLTTFLSILGAKSFAYDAEIDGIYYNFSGDNATVTFYSEDNITISRAAYSGAITIPEFVTYNDVTYSVTSIGSFAFSRCTDLTSVTIPNSVTIIDNYAFKNCSGLTNITIPNSVTKIGNSVFEECSGLTNIDIPNSVTSIGNHTFYECRSLKSLTIPNSVTNIDGFAFYNCRSLESVTIPNSVTSIGNHAFSGTGLTSVTIPNSVTSIGNNAFGGPNLTSVINHSNAILSKNYTEYSSLNLIFGSQITEFIVGNEVQSIGDYAFYGFSKLSSITIGSSVTSIGNYAFSNCSSLTGIRADENNTVYSSIDGVLFNKPQTELITYPFGRQGEYTIPNSVTSIGNYAFYNCSGLTSITIPNSVTSIGNYAFYNCSGLTSVTIPNSVTSIGNNAFYSCTELTSVTIGNSVTSIGNYAFYSCTGLTSVTIPNSVTSIGSGSFRGCRGLTSITIGNSVSKIENAAFGECIGLTSVTINSNAIMSKNYQAPFSLYHIFGNQVTEIVIGDEVTTIGRNAFSGYKELTSLTISKNVTKIGQSAFATYIKIANLICRAVSPPLCDSHALDGIYKSYCTLIVPQGSLAAYQSADQWKDFYIIEEGTNRIKNNGVESKIVHIYDAKGHKVENLQRGMNIVKTSDGTTKKILVK